MKQMTRDEVHLRGSCFPASPGWGILTSGEHRENFPLLPNSSISSFHQHHLCIIRISTAMARYQLPHALAFQETCRDANISRLPNLAFAQKCKKWHRLLIKQEGGFHLGQPLSRRTGEGPHYMQFFLHNIGLEKRFLERTGCS